MRSRSESAASRPTETVARAHTCTWRFAPPRRTSNTGCASRPLAGDARPLGPRDAGLADADPGAFDCELVDDRVGRRRGEALEQDVALCLADAADEVADEAVVQCRVERVGGRLWDLQRDVEEERLPVAALVLVCAVASEQLEPVDLDDHPATAAAT